MLGPRSRINGQIISLKLIESWTTWGSQFEDAPKQSQPRWTEILNRQTWLIGKSFLLRGFPSFKTSNEISIIYKKWSIDSFESFLLKSILVVKVRLFWFLLALDAIHSGSNQWLGSKLLNSFIAKLCPFFWLRRPFSCSLEQIPQIDFLLKHHGWTWLWRGNAKRQCITSNEELAVCKWASENGSEFQGMKRAQIRNLKVFCETQVG